jgi:uncharacterized protein YbjT (DUF2867 family)
VDIATLQHPAHWTQFLDGIDIVVNASGALQDGSRDNLAQIHDLAIGALAAACEACGITRLIQISAPGATLDATTEFMRSKARGDDAIKRSAIDWVIFRPGLVIGPNAYGGSALIRMMAAVPLVNALALADQRVQTVAMSDVTQLVLDAVEGRIPRHTDVELVEEDAHTLRQIVERFRQWMGLPPVLATISVPRWCVQIVSAFADALGYLGWRSPLRSTAMRALQDEIVGDATKIRALRGSPLLSLERTLDAMPATLQERWFARLYLLMPLMVAMLAAFWMVSGAIGMIDIGKAAASLPADVFSPWAAHGMVVGGAVIDIVLGAAILYRPFSRRACLGMVGMTLIYLAAGSMVTPALWLDPLGPFVKVLPAMMLALVTMAVLEER